MKYLLLTLIIIHGLIHLMGFAKAFGYGDIKQLTVTITRPGGVAWLGAALLFITAAVLLLLKKDYWWIVTLLAVVLSQILIILSWKDARFGTIANGILLIVALLGWGSASFENKWHTDILQNTKVNQITAELLTESDIADLPAPVQRYLRYTGVVNKPKVSNMRIVFEGRMREKDKNYFPFTSVQYNFFDNPSRLFFMRAQMKGVTVPGYHRYVNGQASMDIRLFGLFPVVRKLGAVMDKTETVTVFNDMCLLAPATLIDKRIKWELVNDTTVKAVFTNKEISISALLYFNDTGQLINFVSNDRTAVADMKQYPFSTPITSYKNINGFNIISTGNAVWHYPDGEFIYGIFNLKEIAYNVTAPGKSNTR